MRARPALLTVTVTVALVVLGPAAGADTQETRTPVSDGWYQPNPSCGVMTGCLPPALPASPPATTPYPARSLHVGVVAGQETARAVLAFDVSAVTASAGTLAVPLDTDAADGSVSPDAAKLLVCLTHSPWVPADGSIDTPPQADCGTSAALAYIAVPAPHLAADLTPLLAGLPSATGLVLLPDATKVSSSDTWHVVFSAHDRPAAKTPPAALLLTVTDVAPAAPPPVPPAPTVPVVAPAGPVAVPGLVLPGAAATPAPSAQVAPPSVAAAPPSVLVRRLSGPVLTTGHWPYLGLAVFPLAALLLLSFLSRALTMDLGQARRA